MALAAATTTSSGNARKGQRRRDEFLEILRTADNITTSEAVARVGWKGESSYYEARRHHPQWAAEVDAIVAERGLARHPGSRRIGIALAQPRPNNLWKPSDGFAAFRKTFLGHDSPWFHLAAIEAVEQMPGGEVLMILWPPRHGKTALYEDLDTFLLCTKPGILITIGSEKISQAAKITGAIRARLDHGAPGMGPLREKFGPFAPPKGQSKSAAAAQAWSRGAFDVAKKPRGRGGQRDHSMSALGMSSSIIGSRVDLLQVDDPQGQRSLLKEHNTEALVESFRQDWLSRLGPDGRTVILGNRVGAGDFHEHLLEKTDIVDRLIQVPAWDPERGGWLWPEMYDHDYYMAKKRQVGDDAWDRNFMQKGLAGRSQTFNDKIIGECLNNLRSIRNLPQRPASGGEAEICITLDPGFFKAAFHVAQFDPDRFISLDMRLVEYAKAYGSFGVVLEELLRQFHIPGLSLVRTVVIETMAFQRGMLQDDKMRELQAHYDFDLVPFTTGTNKYDPDLGIPQMARMMERAEIDFPNSDDFSRERYEPLYYQMRRYRPGVRGNKVEMDLLMAFWFGVHRWKSRRRTLALGGDVTSQFSFTGKR